MNNQYDVYVMTNHQKSVLYTGVTNDLKRRVYEHKQGSGGGFTRKYGAVLLVYYEVFQDPLNAIAREKQIKGGSRKKKMALVDKFNPDWEDLYSQL
jgi:putative endonuclease